MVVTVCSYYSFFFDEKYLEILAQSDGDILHRYFFIIKLLSTFPYLPLAVWVRSSEIIYIWYIHISFYPEKCKRKKKDLCFIRAQMS